jgi:ankyrin repeat protein
MKKTGLLAGLLVLAFLAYAQDRYPIEDENPEVIKVLKDAGVDLDYPNDMTYTEPFGPALWIRAPTNVFQRLLDIGVPVEPEFSSYITESPLVKAINADNLEVVDLLIKNGANVNRLHRDGMTPVHYAALAEDPAILARIIQAGGIINKTDENRNTPLHTLFMRQSSLEDISKKVERVRILLAQGANINAINSNGDTPLIIAVSSFVCRKELVQALLAGKPNINAANSQGKTALIAAAGIVAYPDIIDLLLNAGANAKLEDNTGRTALDWFDMNHRINKSPVRKTLKDAM